MHLWLPFLYGRWFIHDYNNLTEKKNTSWKNTFIIWIISLKWSEKSIKMVVLKQSSKFTYLISICQNTVQRFLQHYINFSFEHNTKDNLFDFQNKCFLQSFSYSPSQLTSEHFVRCHNFQNIICCSQHEVSTKLHKTCSCSKLPTCIIHKSYKLPILFILH